MGKNVITVTDCGMVAGARQTGLSISETDNHLRITLITVCKRKYTE